MSRTEISKLKWSYQEESGWYETYFLLQNRLTHQSEVHNRQIWSGKTFPSVHRGRNTDFNTVKWNSKGILWPFTGVCTLCVTYKQHRLMALGLKVRRREAQACHENLVHSKGKMENVFELMQMNSPFVQPSAVLLNFCPSLSRHSEVIQTAIT